MGDVKNQENVIIAQATIQKTWEDLLAKVTVADRDLPLGECDKWDDYEAGGPLVDPNSPVVAICTYIYGFESHVYKTLNYSCRFKDAQKIQTLGPFAAALYVIINYT